MDAEDLYEVHKAAPEAIIIASHLEAVNHAVLAREKLQEFVDKKAISDNTLIPQDGEEYCF